MPSRRRSRYRAVQLLYQCDLRSIGPAEAIANYYGGLHSEEGGEKPHHDPFMEELVTGAMARREEIDARIDRYSSNWRIERMPAVDRNIIRLAVHELVDGQLPAAIIIDQAMELARQFSEDASLPFINGVLDSIRKEVEATSPMGDPETPPEEQL